MRYRILGSLQVIDPDGQPHTFERRHTRILAVLLLSANRVVGRDYLIDAVWDDAPPATAARQLQNCISNLRQHLPWKHAIAAEPSGYRIRLDSDHLDAEVFEVAVARARERQAAGRVAEAAVGLREALALWRGPALAGLTGRAIEAGSARLNEQRLATLEDYFDLELHQGHASQLVGDLMELASANPLREGVVGLLMRALQVSGRQSEALQAFEQLRVRLADEMGLDPGPRLQELHRCILRNQVFDVPVENVQIGRMVPRQLPAPARHFVGRDCAQADLDRLAESSTEAVMLAVIHGTGGIGKTALAVRWAHRAAARFPDGQLFVNLRGFDPAGEPMNPAEAVRGFLDALCVPAERIPVGLDAQASLYRTMLSGRRMLIVLDNARDVDQVRPLLPGSRGCMAIITSRHELTGLVAVEGAQPLTLDLLTAGEARHLLASHLGQARLEAEPAATTELVARCAQLPLALAIIAARAAAHPTFPLATFTAELADAQRRLDAVDGGDQHTQVRSVFSWSYQRLSSQAARLFRLLGLDRGKDITVAAAAGLAGIPTSQARQLLSDLARAHLVTEHVTGRYAFHDLLSAYATEQAQTHDSLEERQAAVRRLLGYYVHAAAAADVLAAPHRRRTPLPDTLPPNDLPRFDDHAGAMAWLELERGNLVAAVRLARDHQHHDLGWRLASLLFALFHLEKHWDDWIGTHKIGLECANACDDPRARFTMLSSLGTAYRERRKFPESIRSHRAALEVSQALGDRHGEAQSLNGLGAAYSEAGDKEEARLFLSRALEIRREVGDRWGEAITICNIGEDDLYFGRPAEARRRFRQALEIRREIGDRWGEAMALSLIGQAYAAEGRAGAAIEHLSKALEIHRDLRDHSMEAFALRHLGLVHRGTGSAGLGDQCLREALAIYTRLGMPDADEIRALLGEVIHRV
ncbi:MAG TPA: BTAD domain-containing putative transcriptional regulator [Candidatus Limnocylindrales bacterium]|nr:BTAD domain-containing putative transcriptional regulator [Candidatus Limnocylindrales bacterium]